MGGVNLAITITDRSSCEAVAAWYREHGVSLILTVLGRGTATTEILDYLGLEATEKAVLFCAAARSSQWIREAERELLLNVPGRGILMTIPVNGIGGAAARDYLLNRSNRNQEGENAVDKKYSWPVDHLGHSEEASEKNPENQQAITHELILVITNEGCTDRVMDAAREAGATGGTSIRAKGTGAELARKFFGVSIASGRELIFILTRVADKKAIMKSIMTKAGFRTPAQSLVFSLPVTDVAGPQSLF